MISKNQYQEYLKELQKGHKSHSKFRSILHYLSSPHVTISESQWQELKQSSHIFPFLHTSILPYLSPKIFPLISKLRINSDQPSLYQIIKKNSWDSLGEVRIKECPRHFPIFQFPYIFRNATKITFNDFEQVMRHFQLEEVLKANPKLEHLAFHEVRRLELERWYKDLRNAGPQMSHLKSLHFKNSEITRLQIFKLKMQYHKSVKIEAY